MPHRLRRLVLTTLLGSAAVLSAAPASHAATEYLGPLSTPGTAAFGASSTAVAHRFTVPTGAGATINSGTAMVQGSPVTWPTSLLIYDNSGAGGSVGALLATLSQVDSASGGFTPPYGAVFQAQYSGSVTLSPGTYYASVSSTSGQNVWAGAGSQTSLWTWGPKSGSNYPYYFTVDSRATWIASSNASAPMITLSDAVWVPAAAPVAAPAVDAGQSMPSVPGPILQQVPAPASGSCADLADADHAMGTGLTGGWGLSWAEWANGPVCTRTLAYADGAWHLG